jgi:hypothetical protein
LEEDGALSTTITAYQGLLKQFFNLTQDGYKVIKEVMCPLIPRSQQPAMSANTLELTQMTFERKKQSGASLCIEWTQILCLRVVLLPSRPKTDSFGWRKQEWYFSHNLQSARICETTSFHIKNDNIESDGSFDSEEEEEEEEETDDREGWSESDGCSDTEGWLESD